VIKETKIIPGNKARTLELWPFYYSITIKWSFYSTLLFCTSQQIFGFYKESSDYLLYPSIASVCGFHPSVNQYSWKLLIISSFSVI